MFRLLSVAFCLLVFASCRKDQLSWQSATQLESHTGHQLNRLFFVNDTLCFAVGGVRYANATILRSADGGATWQYTDVPEAGKILNDICMGPGQKLYACGIDGKMLVSEDLGQTWMMHQMPEWLSFKTLAFPSGDSGIIMGGISFYEGRVARFDGMGQGNWSDSLPYEINTLRFANSYTGYAAGYGVLLKTNDGGHSWRQLEGITSDNFTNLHLLHEKMIWVCGYEGSIFKTTDGGESWQCLRNGNDVSRKKYHLYDIAMLNEYQGYCVGEKGLVLYTDDGGQHWMEIKPFTKVNLRSLVLSPQGDLLICGEGGALWRVRSKT